MYVLRVRKASETPSPKSKGLKKPQQDQDRISKKHAVHTVFGLERDFAAASRDNGEDVAQDENHQGHS